MLIHNLLVSLRNFNRYKASFLINLGGLIGGLTTALFIYLWAAHELSVDKFHKDEGQIVRLVSDNGGNKTLLNTSPIFAQELADAIPEIELIVNSSWGSLESGLAVDETTYASTGEFGSSDFFELFSYPLIHGETETILEKPNAIVISESLAKKLFNTTDAVGRSLQWRWFTALEDVVVTGVFKDPPVNSSMQFDYVLSFQIFERRFRERLQRGNRSARSYFKLTPNAEIDVVNQKIAKYTRENYPRFQQRPSFLISYSDLYLRNNYENGEAVGGRIIQVRLFIVIGILILVIACVNFTNLATSRAALRTKEIGVRKVMGANKKSLVCQFLIEACLLSLIAGICSIVLVIALFPSFEQLAGHSINRSVGIGSIGVFLIIILLTGILSGIYPAFYLSNFKPVRAVKGQLAITGRDQWLRKGLVVLQFSISLILITSVFVVYHQMKFIQNKDLGYSKNFILNFRTSGMNREKQQTFLTEARKITGVTKASGITHALFGAQRSGANITWRGKDPEAFIVFEHGYVDYEMLELLEMEIIQGRFFSRSFSDERSKVVINEVTKELMEMDDPIGETLTVGDENFEVIGVASNFHFQSLHEEIKPTFFRLNSGFSMTLALKLEPQNLQETLAKIEVLYSKVNGGYPFEYSFHDQDRQGNYESEMRMASLSKYAAGLAIVISSLGLFGLISFIVERKAKEMGIRKVLGASSQSLVAALSKDFLMPLAISSLIGTILAAYLLNSWLDGFAYRIDLQWWFFVMAVLMLLFSAAISSSSQIVKTINRNPVDALKEE